MNYVVLQLASSLDGYIAREDGSVDFLNQENETLSKDFTNFLSTIDVIVMGRGSYLKMLEFGDLPFKDKQIFVMSSTLKESPYSHVTITNQSIGEWINHDHGRIWLFGGSKLIQSFINLNLIDEFQIHIVPHIIGRGMPLFLPSKSVMNLKLTNHQTYDDGMTLTYKRDE